MLFACKGNKVAILADSAPDVTFYPLQVAWNVSRREAYLASIEKGREESWLGAKNLEQLLHEYENGWEAGVEKIKQIEIEIDVEQGESVKRRRVRAASGDNLDMFRVYRGDLDSAWERCERKHKIGNRMVNLVVSVSGSAYVKADQLFYAGACAIRIVEELELAGYSVAVYGAICVGYPSGTVTSGTYVYKVKEHNEAIDLNTLAVDLCRAGCFRYFGFQAVEVICDVFGSKVSSSYGRASELNYEQLSWLGLATNSLVISESILSKESAGVVVSSVLSFMNTHAIFDAAFFDDSGKVSLEKHTYSEPDVYATTSNSGSDAVFFGKERG